MIHVCFHIVVFCCRCLERKGTMPEKRCVYFNPLFWFYMHYLYLYRRVCVCLSVCVCVSFRRYTRRRLWSDRDQILHTHADSSPNGSEQNKNQPRVTQGGFGGGFRGSEIHKSGMTTKRVDQLAPNLVHACGFIWECT